MSDEEFIIKFLQVFDEEQISMILNARAESIANQTNVEVQVKTKITLFGETVFIKMYFKNCEGNPDPKPKGDE